MSGSIRVIRPEDWTEMPWRNGGGTTSEIAAQKQNGAWLWRLSTAIVAQDGPYSQFPGLTRISTVIAGAGTDIADMGAEDWQRIGPLIPTQLDGNRAVQGRLVDGPIRFLNLFFDSTRVAASVAVIQLDGDRTSGPHETMIFCIEGQCGIGSEPGIGIATMHMACRLPAAQRLSGQASLVSIHLEPVV
ncbi:HutD family protein [Antarctobacter sp.]|uniref:HutD/Ves family protein n=1 Tax=Antarctobacter sp. TaxID=1872577 RepID=UPI003A8C92FC